MKEKSPREKFDEDLVISYLFAEKISPEHAAGLLNKSFRSNNISAREVHERIKSQDELFRQGNWTIAEEQLGLWNKTAGILKDLNNLPLENRLNPIEISNSDNI